MLDKTQPEILVSYKNKTPLFFGLKKDKQSIFSSDTNAMKVDLDSYYFLKNEEVLEVNSQGFICFNSKYKKVEVKLLKYKRNSNLSNNIVSKSNSITYNEMISQKSLKRLKCLIWVLVLANLFAQLFQKLSTNK